MSTTIASNSWLKQRSALADGLMKAYLRNTSYVLLMLFCLIWPSPVTLTSRSPNQNPVPSAIHFQSMDSLATTERLLKRTLRARRHVDPRIAEQRRPVAVDFGFPEVAPLSAAQAKPQASGADVFISVKTTARYHATRLRTILDTWFELARDQIYFFTDEEDKSLATETGDHLINTKCSSSHHRQALCCKLGVEFDFFLTSDKSWFCHFDDDNYVNVPQLFTLLSKFGPERDLYLGRPSTREPIQIVDRERPQQKVSFWFATGGAGFCLSRSLAEKMRPIASIGKFVALGEKIRLPDDVTMGYVIESLLNVKLTVVPQFHSHLESMNMIDVNSLAQQISLSAGSYSSQESNVVAIDGDFTELEDPTRFKSIHCHLFAWSQKCRRPSSPQPASGSVIAAPASLVMSRFLRARALPNR